MAALATRATSRSDDALVAAVADGDADAFRELSDRHLARIFGFACRLLGNDADADDVTQEVFLRLWRHASRWRPDGAARLTTWLHRVTLNACHDRRARPRDQPLDTVPEPTDPCPPASVRVHERELASHVNDALATLPERQRTAIALCHYQGLGNIEAAEVMDISVEALESLLGRGRRTLRARLSALAPELLGDE